MTKKQKNSKAEAKSPLPTPNSQLPNLDDWLTIGKIVAPQGLAGELRVYPETDFPERFEVPGTRWLLRPGQTEPQPIELLDGRYLDGKNLYVITIAGVENRNQAEELRNCQLFVPASDRPELGEDEYHVVDLIGLAVFLQESGELLGNVVDVIPAGNDLLEVQLVTNDKEQMTKDIDAPVASRRVGQKTVLIPFVREIAPVVDLQARRIEITPPPGLLEIN
ncbi:ribosome maturation factor RimM [Nostoc sp. FACHB-152]|uniref:ribosome maturation factor RimM n=1 Tax=unclassified Nostoc TaxID=2593658 RepID=UPI001689F609|nr:MULTISPECIES: ribosome maturation factor RimM [unclassified Nostoc]MBD2450708.1 ribosome maturation factor RimM [Nostoc sp. FACHB-152]MBD2471920.1 ribosome maturation factor RimM [Nostoc sp. FACHB-145]